MFYIKKASILVNASQMTKLEEVPIGEWKIWGEYPSPETILSLIEEIENEQERQQWFKALFGFEGLEAEGKQQGNLRRRNRKLDPRRPRPD
jgi:hypothetical protein